MKMNFLYHRIGTSSCHRSMQQRQCGRGSDMKEVHHIHHWCPCVFDIPFSHFKSQLCLPIICISHKKSCLWPVLSLNRKTIYIVNNRELAAQKTPLMNETDRCFTDLTTCMHRNWCYSRMASVTFTGWMVYTVDSICIRIALVSERRLKPQNSKERTTWLQGLSSRDVTEAADDQQFPTEA